MQACRKVPSDVANAGIRISPTDKMSVAGLYAAEIGGASEWQ